MRSTATVEALDQDLLQRPTYLPSYAWSPDLCFSSGWSAAAHAHEGLSDVLQAYKYNPTDASSLSSKNDLWTTLCSTMSCSSYASSETSEDHKEQERDIQSLKYMERAEETDHDMLDAPRGSDGLVPFEPISGAPQRSARTHGERCEIESDSPYDSGEESGSQEHTRAPLSKAQKEDLWKMRVVEQRSWPAICGLFLGRSLSSLQGTLGGMTRRRMLHSFHARHKSRRPAARDWATTTTSASAWSRSEITGLRFARRKGIPWNEISQSLGRSVAACHKKYDFEIARERGKKTAGPWSGSDFAALTTLVSQRSSWTEISDCLHREIGSVRKGWQALKNQQTKQLGRWETCAVGTGSGQDDSERARHGWVGHSSDDEVLVSLHKRGFSWAEIAKMVHRSVGSVRKRWYVLRQRAIDDGIDVATEFPSRPPGRPSLRKEGRAPDCESVSHPLKPAPGVGQGGCRKLGKQFSSKNSRSDTPPMLKAKYAALHHFNTVARQAPLAADSNAGRGDGPL